MTANWMDSASCKGSHPDLFFPMRGESTATAKRVCAGCPVKTECLNQAMTYSEKHGIWGGLSERQRRALRRELRGVVRDPVITEMRRERAIHLDGIGCDRNQIAAALGVTNKTIWRYLQEAS